MHDEVEQDVRESKLYPSRRLSPQGVKEYPDLAEMLAEGEFNRFYARGLCLRAIAEGIDKVVVYRGKEVLNPRPESEALLGKHFPVEKLLQDLRHHIGTDTALGLPAGPNSGLSICLK